MMRTGFIAGVAFALGLAVGFLLAGRREPDVPQPRTVPLTATPASFRTGFDAAVRRANALMDQQQFADAAREYENALLLQDSADVRTDLGICYRHLNRIDSALSSFRAALAREPQHFEARYNLAVVLLEQGRVTEASRHLEQLKTERPGDERLALLERAFASAKPR